MPTVSRGIRIANPGNIRISATDWLGKITPSTDPEFETFDTPIHGIRAIAKIILTYSSKYAAHTIRDIITRWAPPSENDTYAYIEDVEDRTGIDRTRLIDLRQPFNLCKIVQAIIHHENGCCPYTSEEIATGVQMALS